MRYHYEKPTIYLSMYGKRYICDHPVYDSCTLFEIGDKGLAVIQQRYDAETKSTFWTEVDAIFMPARPVDGKLRNWIMSTRAQTKWNSDSMKEATSI